MNKEISMELEVEREEELYSDEIWCLIQYEKLEEEGLGVVEHFPCDGWMYLPLQPEGELKEIHEEIEEEKWEEIFFTREEENMEEEEMIGIKLDRDTLGDWDKVFEKLREVENLPRDWEWEILDEHYNGNFTEYTVLIGEHIYEVSFFTTSRDEETGDILEERMDYFYLQSLEEYQKEQEERENRRGGWEF